MNKILIIVITLVFLVIPTVSAVNWTYYDQYTAPNISLPCTDYFGMPCNSTIFCNITLINYPNGTNLVQNISINHTADGFYNYQTHINLSDLGDYPCQYTCWDAAANQDTDTCNFTIAEPWKSLTLMLVILFIGLAFILTFYSIKLEEEHIFLKLIFFFALFPLLLIMISSLGIMMPTEIKGYASTAFMIVIFTAFFSFIYFFISFIYASINNKKIKLEEE